MYNQYHLQLKKDYGNNISLLYTDTDSLFIKLTNYDFQKEIVSGELSKYMDRSNFPRDRKDFFDDSCRGALGKLKSETGVHDIVEIIALQAKSYSVLLSNGETKKASKGIQNWIQHKLTHNKYKEIIEGKIDNFYVTVTNIGRKKGKLVTVRSNKRALSNVDIKRYHLGDGSTLGYGHPKIPKIRDRIISKSNSMSKAMKKRKYCANATPTTVDLCFPATKKACKLFNIIK